MKQGTRVKLAKIKTRKGTKARPCVVHKDKRKVARDKASKGEVKEISDG